MDEATVRALLAPLGIDELLEVVVTSSDIGAAKPDPRGVLEACRRLGVTPDRALLIGDRPVDRDAAANAGVAFVAVDRGLPDAVARALAARSGSFAEAAAGVGPSDMDAIAAVQARQAQLTKPAGSLGRLEELGSVLAGITGRCPPPIPTRPVVAVFAGDHGVVASGVTPWPQDITTAMVTNFAAGGAAINALARQVGASVEVVDVGVARDLGDMEGVLHRKVRLGTDDLVTGPAMTTADVRAALDVGASVAAMLVARGHDLLVTGEMGIGNTTASAALIAAFTHTPAEDGHRAGHRHRRRHARAQDEDRRQRGRSSPVLPRSGVGAERGGRARDRRARRLHRRRCRGTDPGRHRRRDRVRGAPRGRGARARSSQLVHRRPSVVRTGRHRRAARISGWIPCSTSICVSARAPARAWRYRSCKPRRAYSTRWRPSTSSRCRNDHGRLPTARPVLSARC